jgi:hypothetical protein
MGYCVVLVANATNCRVLIVIDDKFKFHFFEIDDTKLDNVNRHNCKTSKQVRSRLRMFLMNGESYKVMKLKYL